MFEVKTAAPEGVVALAEAIAANARAAEAVARMIQPQGNVAGVIIQGAPVEKVNDFEDYD
jgi:hypothetical protein